MTSEITKKSQQWSFTIPLKINTLPNLYVAAEEGDVKYLTYAETSTGIITGYVRTKKRNRRSAMRALFGKKAEFIESKVKSPRDTLMSIQMSPRYWESGNIGTQAKFLSDISKLKAEIHDGVKGSKLASRKLYKKYQPMVQAYIDFVDARKVIEKSRTITQRPRITESEQGKTKCITVAPPLSSVDGSRLPSSPADTPASPQPAPVVDVETADSDDDSNSSGPEEMCEDTSHADAIAEWLASRSSDAVVSETERQVTQANPMPT